MYGKTQESRLFEIIPLIRSLTPYGQYPVLFLPESPQGAPLGMAAVVDGLMEGSLFGDRRRQP